MKLLGDHVLVLLDELESMTPAGIIIPDTVKDRSARNAEQALRGTVYAAGPGTAEEPTVLREGDRVLMHPYDGIEMEIEGVKYVYIHETDLIGQI